MATANASGAPPWHLERMGTGVTMTAHFERRVVSAGEPIDVVVAMPKPPDLPWQDHITARLTLDGRPVTGWFTEGSAHRRMVVLAQARQTKAVTVGTEITATVYRYHVVAGPPKIAVRDLSAREKASDLASIGNLDYQSPAFQAYLTQKGLRWRRADGESLTDFIVRAATQIQKDFTYFDGVQDRRLSALMASRKGDCGAFSGVFAATMRANGAPAQLWAGFRRLPSMPNAWQPHVVAAVFVPKVGWYPVDLTSGDKPVYSMEGENNAIFVMHLDDGFALSPKGWGALQPDWMQPTAFYYHGGKIVSGLDCAADIRFSETTAH